MKNILKILTIVLGSSVLSSGVSAQGADGEHHMHKSDMHDHGNMMSSNDERSMQIVTAKGVINKVMAEHHMFNVSHEPIPELNWPKMKMNFQIDTAVDLSNLKPGQTVQFKLQVDKDQNYLVKEIAVVK